MPLDERVVVHADRRNEFVLIVAWLDFDIAELLIGKERFLPARGDGDDIACTEHFIRGVRHALLDEVIAGVIGQKQFRRPMRDLDVIDQLLIEHDPGGLGAEVVGRFSAVDQDVFDHGVLGGALGRRTP